MIFDMLFNLKAEMAQLKLMNLLKLNVQSHFSTIHIQGRTKKKDHLSGGKFVKSFSIKINGLPLSRSVVESFRFT